MTDPLTEEQRRVVEAAYHAAQHATTTYAYPDLPKALAETIPTKSARWGGQTIWDGTIVIYANRDTLLPDGFTVQEGKPNIIVRMIGRHSMAEYLIDDKPRSVWPLPNSYNEAVWFIPWVIFRKKFSAIDGPHLFITRMMVDAPVPMLIGNAMFCYRKELNFLIHPSYETRRPSDLLPAPLPPELFDGFAQVEALFELPIFGTVVDRNNTVLRMVRSRWRIASTHAYLSECRSDLLTYHARLKWRLYLPNDDQPGEAHE
jgi:hypothetical protein